MPRSAGHKEKLFALFEYLLDETDDTHGVTIEEIRAHLASRGIGAERKGLYDDFAVLSNLGFPVERMRTSPPRYRLAERIFTLPELKMLVDAIQSSRFIPKEESITLIRKLERFAGRHHAAELSRQVYVEGRVKATGESAMQNVDLLHTAIREGMRLSFCYYEYNAKKEKVLRHGGKRYEVSPYAMVWNNENYYLIAFDEEDKKIKHFRVDKLTDVEICKQKRTITQELLRFNPADYSEKTFGMYGGREELVTLRCAESLAGVMIDRFGNAPTFFPDGEGYFRVSLRVMVSPNFYSFVLGFGTQVEILSPADVREEFVRILTGVQTLYAKAPKEKTETTAKETATNETITDETITTEPTADKTAATETAASETASKGDPEP